MNNFGVPQVTPAEVKSRLDRGDPVILLDVREPYEVEIASIKGAKVIPSGEVLRRAGEIPKDRDVVVFCHGGGRSLLAAYQLIRRGYTRVANMAGGIDRWSTDVDPSVPQYD